MNYYSVFVILNSQMIFILSVLLNIELLRALKIILKCVSIKSFKTDKKIPEQLIIANYSDRKDR